MTTRKVLITGISGFVGPYLAQRLLSQGNEVTGLVTLRADNKKPKRLVEMGLVSNVQPISGDITNLSNLISVIHEVQPDWIFHLVGPVICAREF